MFQLIKVQLKDEGLPQSGGMAKYDCNKQNICTQGERITLVFAAPEDKRLIYDMLVSPEVIDLMFDEDNPAPTWEEFDEEPDSLFIGKPGEEGSYLLLKLDDEVIGATCYYFTNGRLKPAELDIWISSTQHLGKGYGAEALNLVIDYVHKNYNIKTFTIRPWAKNVSAVKAYKKCGFKEIEMFNPSDYYSDELLQHSEGDYGSDGTVNLIYQID